MMRKLLPFWSLVVLVAMFLGLLVFRGWILESGYRGVLVPALVGSVLIFVGLLQVVRLAKALFGTKEK